MSTVLVYQVKYDKVNIDFRIDFTKWHTRVPTQFIQGLNGQPIIRKTDNVEKLIYYNLIEHNDCLNQNFKPVVTKIRPAELFLKKHIHSL